RPGLARSFASGGDERIARLQPDIRYAGDVAVKPPMRSFSVQVRHRLPIFTKGARDCEGRSMSDESKSPPPDQPVPRPVATGDDKGKASKTRGLQAVLTIIGAIIVVFVIIPKAFHAWHTVSTDDAYVNSYVTFVAPRVGGQVARVLVDDNNRVKKGDVLVELDPEPLQVQFAIKQAAVDSAQAQLVTTQATV